MRPLAAVERFFERLFERPSARLFRTRLQPVQLQRRIERAMEHERLSGAERTLVPNRFRVHLHPADLATFGDAVDSLAADLAAGALSFARAHRYALLDRPRVDLVADPAAVPGEVRDEARFADRQAAVSAASSPAVPDDQPFDPDNPAHVSQTMVFAVPTIEGPDARLRELRRDGTERE